MKSVKLKIINKSKSKEIPNIIIFQKFSQKAFAWQVIKHLDVENYHPFLYNFQLEIFTGDAWGNFTFPQVAQKGEIFEMRTTPTGRNILTKSSQEASNNLVIELKNLLRQGSISANLARNQQIIDKINIVVPGQKAVFASLNDLIYFGVNPSKNLEEGDPLSLSFITDHTQSFDMAGLDSASIILTGGGEGTEAEAYKFTIKDKKLSA